jgi:hypothetical protein
VENPSANLSPIWPPAFLSRFWLASVYMTGLLMAYYIACKAFYFGYINNYFEAYYKKGNVALPLIRKPPLYLSYLFTGNDLLYRAFRTNIRAYNYAFAFILISYKKNMRINFSREI